MNLQIMDIEFREQTYIDLSTGDEFTYEGFYMDIFFLGLSSVFLIRIFSVFVLCMSCFLLCLSLTAL